MSCEDLLRDWQQRKAVTTLTEVVMLCLCPFSGLKDSFHSWWEHCQLQPLPTSPLGTALTEESRLHEVSHLHKKDRTLVLLGQLWRLIPASVMSIKLAEIFMILITLCLILLPSFTHGNWAQEPFLINYLFTSLHFKVHFLKNPTYMTSPITEMQGKAWWYVYIICEIYMYQMWKLRI